MTATTAALVLAWVAIVVLFLGCTGMMRMIRSLQEQLDRQGRTLGTDTSPRARAAARFAPTRAPFTLVLLSSDSCLACIELAPEFGRFAERHRGRVEFAHLVSAPGSVVVPGIESVVDPRAVAVLSPGYTPALVVVGRDGTILDVGPAADLDSLQGFIERHTSPEPVKDPT